MRVPDCNTSLRMMRSAKKDLFYQVSKKHIFSEKYGNGLLIIRDFKRKIS